MQIADHVTLNSERLGWDNKEFQVIDWKLKPGKKGNLAIEMELQEISLSVFADPVGSTVGRDNIDRFITNNNTNLFQFNYVPPIGISATSSTRINNENLINLITITTTANEDDWIDYVEVRYRDATDDDAPWLLVGAGEVGVSEIIDPSHGEYIASAQGVNTFGVRGPIHYSSRITVERDETIPANVTGFGYSLVDSGLFFQWDPVPDPDLSFYRNPP